MKKAMTILFSPKTTLVLLVIFIITIISATFIENSFDTTTAKILVYEAKWFEALLGLMVLNFLGSIKRYQFFKWKKIPGFIFHFSFILMIIGAFITRYFGYEGEMTIREGASSNFIYSDKTYLNIQANDGVNNYKVEYPLMLGMITNNSFQIDMETAQKETIEINYKSYLKKAQKTYEEGLNNGVPMLVLKINVNEHSDEIQLKSGEAIIYHNIPIAFNNNTYQEAIKITGQIGNLSISYPANIKTTAIFQKTEAIILKDSLASFSKMTVYEPEGTGIAMSVVGEYKNAVVKYTENDADENLPGALFLNIIHKGETKEVVVLGGPGQKENFQTIALDGINLSISYGAKKIELPFSIRLNNFELEKYPGSNNPSTIESDVTLIDQRNEIQQNHKIFVNNVLDYDGYRFFQISYDEDEKGTILSVNYDFWGTWITYFSYFLLILGITLNFLIKKSRFWNVISEINQLRQRRDLLLAVVLTLVFSEALFSQVQNRSNQINQTSQNVPPHNPYAVSEEHANKFGELIVQTYEGRFAPVHTLAIDVMHKIAKKDQFDIPNQGNMSAIQVFMDILLNPDFWRYQKIIYIGEKSIADLLGVEGKHASLNDLFNFNNEYKLGNLNTVAFRKPDAKRNKFDRELLKFTERAEVFMMISRGSLLTLFPVPNDANKKWISWDNEWALRPITGNISVINDELKLSEFNYTNLMSIYLQETYNATKTGNYTNAEKIINHLKTIQRQDAFSAYIPSEAKIEREIKYNKLAIFNNLKLVYAILSVLLLIFTFAGYFRPAKSKLLYSALYVTIVLLVMAFMYQTYGMVLRWYLSGHAPLSNGYEVLLLVSWSSILAGFCFMRYSKIALAGATMLAFFVLLTASLSNYDPQLTVLQPGLKSDWLIYHVASLTISYGFFGLAFFLGLFNMTIYLFKTPKNQERLAIATRELTYINELILTIGLYLVIVGTFLGAVWANESWGRYWGWDPKETWSLIIIIFYTIILHVRLVPALKDEFIFNTFTIVGFSSVLMTFFGLNYYFTKGMHTYANSDTPVFPIWALVTILLIVTLIVLAGLKKRNSKEIVLE